MSHLYCWCQKHKHFGLSYIRLRWRSTIKTVHAPVIISISLHHKQCDNPYEIQRENAVIHTWCFNVILSSWAPCKCVYNILLKAKGQCPLQVWWLLCLWTWPTSQFSSEVLAKSGLSRAWALEHTQYSSCDRRYGSIKTFSQFSFSSVVTTSHRYSLLLLSIISYDIQFGFSRQSLLLMGFEASLPSAWLHRVYWVYKISLLSALALLPI